MIQLSNSGPLSGLSCMVGGVGVFGCEMFSGVTSVPTELSVGLHPEYLAVQMSDLTTADGQKMVMGGKNLKVGSKI